MTNKTLVAKIAKPYAEALLNLAKSESQKNSLNLVTADINDLLLLLAKSKLLKEYFANPIVSVSAKKELIKKVLSPHLGTITLKFLYLLVDRRRISILEAIAEKYIELVYQVTNVKVEEVTSVVELDLEQEVLLTEFLVDSTESNDIELIMTIDESILGGLVVKIGSKVVDMSLQGELRKMAACLGIKYIP
jgi:F-type H+-transporting ATPase subunit delta